MTSEDHFSRLIFSTCNVGTVVLVISELKVGATVQGGLSHKSLRRDIDKLLLLLDEYQSTHDTEPLLATSASLTTMPAASTTALRSRIYSETVAADRIKVLPESSLSRPELTEGGLITR